MAGAAETCLERSRDAVGTLVARNTAVLHQCTSQRVTKWPDFVGVERSMLAAGESRGARGDVGIVGGQRVKAAATGMHSMDTTLRGQLAFVPGNPVLPCKAGSASASARLPRVRRHAPGTAGKARRSSAHGGVPVGQRDGHRVLARAADARVQDEKAVTSSDAAVEWSSVRVRETFLSFYEKHPRYAHVRMDSASLVPSDPTILLTIAGMVPFKPVFLGLEERSCARATSSQKCIRTNDIENVGVTKRHHTFFEMLGNFSFGDYFKPEACQMAWELLTTVFGIPTERLAVSVFEDDDEAYAIWRDIVGVPETRIKRMGAKDNFWASGPTGPCGPCSEIYYDFEPARGNEHVDLEDDARFIELYNLVFMEFNRDAEGALSPLKSKNIDTGMGLERVCQVLQHADNNYETDLMLPIIEKAAQLAGKVYQNCDARLQTSFKVVADHTRAVMHLIADGVRPGNTGRGYIVRRLIRRVLRNGRQAGIDGAFISVLSSCALDLAEKAGYTNCREREAFIRSELEREEARFLMTLERGEDRLQEAISDAKLAKQVVLSGVIAFELYDTFGFPVELTQESAAENGLRVDMAAFDECMEKQRIRARAARESLDLTVGAALASFAQSVGESEFVGYTQLDIPSAAVRGLFVQDAQVDSLDEGQRACVLLERTPFYAEGGGQVGDCGILRLGDSQFLVEDVRKESGAFVHIGEMLCGSLKVGDAVKATVNRDLRSRTKAHHTATHLLQSALRLVLGADQVSQAGSLVDPTRLRFDFNSPRALSPQELETIENMINGWIQSGIPAQVVTMSLDEAVERGAIAMFGEKYDRNDVRVVEVPGVSMELCGGTHVSNTAEIGAFKILNETGIAAGVRRIEAVCGRAVVEFASARDSIVRELCGTLKARPEDVVERVDTLREELKDANKQLESLKKKLAFVMSDALLEKTDQCGPADFKFIVSSLDGVDADGLRAAAERLLQKLGTNSAVVLSAVNGEKVFFSGVAGKDAVRAGVHMGKIIGAVAKLCGGGGGGRPDGAQAGAKDASKLVEAQELAREQIRTVFT
ncbi:Alanine--tRNA ligase [Porphyridium purpureum]|uniref:Alanine--tRNA ligase n=1 Tax=Porphyridium purpureum TaxID=35688 RepID=A0A5J4YW21_PORPP|nr:Alanine--tRNA ligase [Porphyridium purpureum]|eukprot:POR1353..scf209_3